MYSPCPARSRPPRASRAQVTASWSPFSVKSEPCIAWHKPRLARQCPPVSSGETGRVVGNSVFARHPERRAFGGHTKGASYATHDSQETGDGRPSPGLQPSPSGDRPSYAGILSRLEDRIERAEFLARQQRGGQILVHASTARRKELRRALHDQLRHLDRVGDVVAKTQPKLAQHFQLPTVNASGQAYRTAARAMLDEAVAQRELLLANGMASILLDDLRTVLDQYDESVEQAQAGRRAHVGAVAELAVVTSEIMEVVQMFDGLNRYRFRTNADLHAAWQSARNIVAVPRTLGQSPPENAGGEHQIRSMTSLPSAQSSAGIGFGCPGGDSRATAGKPLHKSFSIITLLVCIFSGASS